LLTGCIVAIIIALGISVYDRPHTFNAIEPERLGIEDLTRKVKAELQQLEFDRITKNEETLFRLKDFDLEVSFIIKASQKQKGEVKTEVVVVGAEQEHSREAVHKITLHMEMVPPHPAVIPFSDKQFNPSSEVIKLPPGKIE
jgi:hypothetical protein